MFSRIRSLQIITSKCPFFLPVTDGLGGTGAVEGACLILQFSAPAWDACLSVLLICLASLQTKAIQPETSPYGDLGGKFTNRPLQATLWVASNVIF